MLPWKKREKHPAEDAAQMLQSTYLIDFSMVTTTCQSGNYFSPPVFHGTRQGFVIETGTHLLKYLEIPQKIF